MHIGRLARQGRTDDIDCYYNCCDNDPAIFDDAWLNAKQIVIWEISTAIICRSCNRRCNWGCD